MNLSTNSTTLLQMCSDGGDGASPKFMILVLAQLVLRPSLQAFASKVANADEMSFRFFVERNGCIICIFQIGYMVWA